MYFYQLQCEDYLERCKISVLCYKKGKKINLREAVKKTIESMSDKEIINPTGDWFYNIVDKVCKQNGMSIIENNYKESVDVEDMYWTEVDKREEKKHEKKT